MIYAQLFWRFEDRFANTISQIQMKYLYSSPNWYNISNWPQTILSFPMTRLELEHAWNRKYTDLPGQGLTLVLPAPYIYTYSSKL